MTPDRRVPQRLSGGLNVYVLDETPLDDDAVQLLEVFSGHAAIALANQSLSTTTLALSTNPLHVMQSRAVIERAKGVIMVQLACTPGEAFEHLSRRAQSSNREMRDVAVGVTRAIGQENQCRADASGAADSGTVALGLVGLGRPR